MTNTDFAIPCVNCYTDLAGFDIAGACPVCQRPIAETLYLDVLDTTSGTINVDLDCLSCGYNLKTLPWDAPCPECGTPVAQTLRHGSLHRFPQAWRQSIAEGINMLLIPVISFPLAAIVLALLAPASAAILLGTGIPIVIVLCVLAVGGFAVLGWKDPREDVAQHQRWLRRMSLAFPVLLLPCLIVFATAVMLGHLARSAFDLLATVALGLLMMSIPISVLGTVLSLREVALLARRPDLARSCRFWTWVGVSGCVLLIVSIATTVPVIRAPAPSRQTLAVAYALAGIGSIVIGITYIAAVVVLFRFRRLLAEGRRLESKSERPAETSAPE